MLTLEGKECLVLACYISGVYDVNRSEILNSDDFSIVQQWAESVQRAGLKGILFHNSFSPATCERYSSDHLVFVQVDYTSPLNPNAFRYLVYNDFIKKHGVSIENLFVTDVTDVVLLQNPFVQPLFTENPHALFCGDEPKPLRNDWMLEHANHLRSKIADYAAYEAEFATATLLNCGIIGGSIEVMSSFMEQLASIHEQHNLDNKTAYTGDMGAFNYLVRTKYNDQLIHGAPVNTVFKGYEENRKDCWFRHK
jgi:hypothetical protein